MRVGLVFLAGAAGASGALLKTGTGAHHFSADQEKDCKEGRFLPGCDASVFARYSLVFCATDGQDDVKPLADADYFNKLKAKRGATAKESPKEDGWKKWSTDFIAKEGMSTCGLMATVQNGAPTSPCEYRVAGQDGTPKAWSAKAVAGN